MLRRLPAAAAVATCLVLPAAPALASGTDVIKDCLNNGRLSKTYSQKEYKDALAHMPTDVAEYTDCQSQIRRAQLGLGGGGGTGTSQNPFAGASPQEIAQAQQDIAAAQKTGSVAQRVGPDVVTPGSLAFRKVSAAVSNLPVPLLVVVVLILLGTGGLGAHLYRNRERAGDPRS